jgi:glycerate dehydrogenase
MAYPWTQKDCGSYGIRAFGDVAVFDRTPPEKTVERAAGAAIVLTNKTQLSAAVLDQLPDLRFIGVLATGYNAIDVDAPKRKGIVVSNVPTYGTAWRNSSSPCSSNCATASNSTPTPCALANGAAIPIGAFIAEGFGMKVLACDAHPGLAPLDDVLQQSDVISLHVPLYSRNP